MLSVTFGLLLLLQGAAAVRDARGTFGRDLLSSTVQDYDFTEVRQDLHNLLTSSQDFWPADFGPSGPDYEKLDNKGHYGGLFMRLAWHCNGSFRISDGRGGCDGGRIRTVPEFAWPDNTNLDKALRLLQPIKDKYGDSLSWGDLISLSGNVALEGMGGPTIGFCGGRKTDPDGTASLPLGPTRAQRLIAPCEENGKCVGPLGPSVVGLIYVNPGGPLGDHDPKSAVKDIRSAFGRMGMDDRETVALIGGGHTFGKVHGACPKGPGTGPSEDYHNQPSDEIYNGKCGSGGLEGKGKNTYTSGYEGRWTTAPTTWGNRYFQMLLDYDFNLTTSPAGGEQWVPTGKSKTTQQDAPRTQMLTTDLAFLQDPAYSKIAHEFYNDVDSFSKAFSHAWFKLLHNDMGPATRCGGRDGPPPQPFQDPLPPPTSNQLTIDYTPVIADIERAMVKPVKGAAYDVSADGSPSYAALFITLAYNCASTFRATDYRGGCNGGRIRFPPQADWPMNKGLSEVLKVLEPIKAKHPAVSYADLIVLAGTVAVRHELGIDIAFCPGRADAVDGATSVDLSRRVYHTDPTTAVVDQVNIMGLTAQDFVALVGRPYSQVHAKQTGAAQPYKSNVFQMLDAGKLEFVKASAGPSKDTDILDTVWKVKAGKEWSYVTAWQYGVTQTPQLRPYVTRFAADEEAFKAAFAEAWAKLMNADRFDGPDSSPCDTKVITDSDLQERNVTKMEAVHIPSAYTVVSEWA